MQAERLLMQVSPWFSTAVAQVLTSELDLWTGRAIPLRENNLKCHQRMPRRAGRVWWYFGFFLSLTVTNRGSLSLVRDNFTSGSFRECASFFSLRRRFQFVPNFYLFLFITQNYNYNAAAKSRTFSRGQESPVPVGSRTGNSGPGAPWLDTWTAQRRAAKVAGSIPQEFR